MLCLSNRTDESVKEEIVVQCNSKQFCEHIFLRLGQLWGCPNVFCQVFVIPPSYVVKIS